MSPECCTAIAGVNSGAWGAREAPPGSDTVEASPRGGVSMRKLILPSLMALASVPIIGLSALQAAAPVFADTPGVSPTCFAQTANPHPTDPVGQTTNTLFCTPTNPNGSGTGGSGSGTAGTGAGGSGSTGAKTGGGSAAGGGETPPATPDRPRKAG